MKIIERPQYMEALLGAKGTPDIKVITGIRRCGKSVLLEALADRIREATPMPILSVSISISSNSRN